MSTDVWTVVVTVAQDRTPTGAPTDLVDITCVVTAEHSTEARLIACQMAANWGVMPVADRITDLTC